MSIKRYCVFGCKGLYYTPMHRFPNPMKRPEVFAAWMSTVGDRLKGQNPIQIYKHKRICDRHFGPTQKGGKNRVIRNAVPSVNLKCVVQSIVDIVETDHNYSSQRRELQQMPVEFIKKIYSSKSDLETTSIPYLNSTTVKSAKKVNTAKEDCIKHQNISVATDNPHDDNIDDYDDDIVVETLVPESEESPQDLFSWEKTDTIVADDTMIVSDFTTEASDLTTGFEDISMYKDEQPLKDDHGQRGSETLDYLCNGCGEKITGFRYTCVQCADWDLCAACEARAAHDSHYMLRVPAQRPYKEMQAALAAIRHQMLKENLFLPEMLARVKQEVKVEDPEVPVSAPQLEADPLAAWGTGQNTLEIFPEPKDKDVGPSRRRRKTTRFSLNRTKKLTPTCNQEKTERNSRKKCNAASQITKELCTRTSLENGNLDTCKPKVQHSKSKNSVDIGSDIIKANKPNCQDTHSKETVDPKGTAARNEAIAKNTKQTGPQSNGTKAPSPRRKGTTKVIGSHSTANTNAKKKRYKIRLPPGAHWKQLLMTMVKTRVTVQLEDVMRKKRVAAC